ncbi:hypothetical protein ACFX2C_014935 [Malus domestica]
MVRFYLIIRGLWICSKGIYCIRLLRLYVIMKLQMINLRCLSFWVLPSTEAPNNHPLVPPLSGALPTAETSPEQPL